MKKDNQIMRKTIRIIPILLIILGVSSASYGVITGAINSFSAGEIVSASKMNENFTSVTNGIIYNEDAITNNDNDITTNSASISTNASDINDNVLDIANNASDIQTNANAISAMSAAVMYLVGQSGGTFPASCPTDWTQVQYNQVYSVTNENVVRTCYRMDAACQVMYLVGQSGGSAPVSCPTDWSEADYNTQYSGPNVNNVRTCYICN